MSLTSTNTLPKSTVLDRVIQIVEWLGYNTYDIDQDIPYQVGNYVWSGNKQLESFVGVELQIYQKDGIITVDTRTRVGRSYWDQKQQNKTIKALKDFFGGSFVTDEGKNILFEEDEDEPSLLESGLYLQRWIYHNDLGKLRVLDMNTQTMGRSELTGLPWLDEYNAKIILNNLKVPFLVGAWEKYLKSTFVVLLKCSSDREKIFKRLLNKTKLLPDYLESFSKNNETVEWLLAEWLSFQRPKAILENYQMLNSNIDINAIFAKTSGNQEESLFEKIDHVIDIRNNIAHAAIIDVTLTDDVINQYTQEFVNAADSIYRCLGAYYNIELSEDY
ncbi:MAG: HEPN domain-containing protein [Anaerovoracaceae bacterium]